MRKVAADAVMPVVLMHNQVGTEYDDPVPDIVEGLRQRVDAAVHGGVRQENIIVDPGMGFGKTAEQNLEILRRLGEFGALGLPLLVGMSRKSTIGYVLGLPVEDRVEGTAATVALSIAGGADIVRVHDVKEMSRVARMTDRGHSWDGARPMRAKVYLGLGSNLGDKRGNIERAVERLSELSTCLTVSSLYETAPPSE